MISQDELPCHPANVDDFLSEPPASVVAAVGRMRGDFTVLGAGGKMGLHLCLMLRKAMDRSGASGRLVAVSRFGSVNERRLFEEGGIATQVCDLGDPAQLETLDPVENVILMAGAKFGTTGRGDLLKKMNVEMPEMVANHFGGSTITAFSTGCVYSFVPVDTRGAVEGSETKPVGDYALSCLGREQAFCRASAELATRLALIRLNYAVEFRYGVLVDIADCVLRGSPIDVSTGYVNVIWQRDAVAQILCSHELASTSPFVINITGPEVLRVRDLAIRFGELFDIEPKFCGTETDTAWLSDSSLACRLFGRPETSLEEMCRWIAAWMRSGGETHGKPTGFQKRDGNF